MARRASGMIREAFEKWDEDGNGTISKTELSGVLSQLGDFKPGDVERIMVEADKNGDGLIQYREFVDWLMRPVVTVGGVALYSTAMFCLRADTASVGNPRTVGDGGVMRWDFKKGPVRLDSALSLPKEHTIAMWVLVETSCGWSQLCGDSKNGWGLSIGISQEGYLGVQEPRLGGSPGSWTQKCAEEPTGIELGRWALVVARGMSTTVGPSPTGCTEFLVASNSECARFVGTVDAVGSGLVIGEFGSHCGGVAAMASLAVWTRLLAEEEIRELFLWDAVRFECVTEEEANWLRLNRRRAPKRNEEEEEALAAQLQLALAGKLGGVLDVSNLKLVDSDLPRVLNAVELAFDGVTALALSKNYLTEDGIKAHLVPFMSRLNGNFRIDLRENPDISCDCEEELLEALALLPAAWGCSVDARGTGLKGDAMVTLLNQTPEAQMAALIADKERKRSAALCADFDAQQANLLTRWSAEVDPRVAEESEEGAADAPAPFDKFPDGNNEMLRELRAYLSERAKSLYDRKGGAKLAWAGPAPSKCGTGQLVAHFSYLSKAAAVRSHTDFGLSLRSSDLEERMATKLNQDGALGLHAAVESGAVKVSAASGKSYGFQALTLRLENLSGKQQCILVPAGTIFQHVSWIHHQNLMVGRAAHFRLEPGEAKEQKLGAYCMNRSCACSADDPMELTALFMEDKNILESQGKVWDHLEGLFAKYRAEAGFPDNAKGKKGKRKGKR